MDVMQEHWGSTPAAVQPADEDSLPPDAGNEEDPASPNGSEGAGAEKECEPAAVPLVVADIPSLTVLEKQREMILPLD